ncbi:hypothetical protein [Pseudoalteromonas marina]|uniref:Uncharacterized protein n=1 Tax=Pseudoalteromonas marina TaxID=267375 RepID=A0ABT9FG96_9GAMM|nr:hypothetical protein [Pseudoalteromonas marina]MDP2565808.1 hypothetical protein [Pseudoalteromonas marina]
MLKLTSISNGSLAVICRRSTIFNHVNGDIDTLEKVRAAWRIYLYNLPSNTVHFNWVDAWYAFVEYAETNALEDLIKLINADYDGSIIAINPANDQTVGSRVFSTSFGNITVFDDSTVQLQSSEARTPACLFMVDWEFKFKLTA